MKDGQRKDGNTKVRFPGLMFEEIFRPRNRNKAGALLKSGEHEIKSLTWVLIINELLLFVSIMKICHGEKF